MRKLLKALLLAGPFFLLQNNPAYAHERWFTDQDGQHIGESHWLDWLNWLIILGGVLLMALLVWLERSEWYGRLQERIEKFHQRMPRGIDWRIVAGLAGAMLIYNAVTGVFLAPDLLLPGVTVTARSAAQLNRAIMSGDSLVYWDPSTFGAIAQLLLGILLIGQISFLVPGVLILVVAIPMAVINFVPDLLLDYLAEFVALALALIFFGMQASPLDRRIAARLKLDPARFAHLPVPIIRIGLGLTLAVLALHNKLLAPNMALSFLDNHYLNFMEFLGFAGFTNIRFVFAAGVTELAVGLLLISGIATRAVALIAFLLMDTTMAILGPDELIGHLPVMGIELLLIYRGSGGFAWVPQMFAKRNLSARQTPGIEPVSNIPQVPSGS